MKDPNDTLTPDIFTGLIKLNTESEHEYNLKQVIRTNLMTSVVVDYSNPFDDYGECNERPK